MRDGDQITLISPQGNATPFGTVPRISAYTVVGDLRVGMNEYDSSVVFMPLPTAQVSSRSRTRVTGSRSASRIRTSATVMRAIRAALRGRPVLERDWRHANDSIFGALQVRAATSCSSMLT